MVERQSPIFTSPLPSRETLKHIPKNARILDIACGYGRVLKYLAEIGYTDLNGNDISKDLIQEAKQNIPQADFTVEDMRQYSPTEDFDLVLLMGAIEYILKDEEQKELIRRIRQLLRTGGFLFFESFVMDNLSYYKQYLVGFLETLHWGRFKNRKGLDCHHTSTKELRQMILKEFEIITETRENFRTWSGKTVKGYSVLARKK